MTQSRFRRLMGLLLAVFALTAAACAGETAATKPSANPDFDPTTVATPLLIDTGPAFDAVLEGEDPDDVRGALHEAERLAGFDLRLPTAMPTSVQGPQRVRVVPVTGDGQSFRIELNYTGGSTFEYENRTYESTFELFLAPFRMAEVQGEPWRDDLSGYAVHRLVNGTDANGLPVQTIYTARAAEETIVMVFTGEQPTPQALEAMLASFVPLADWSP